MITVSVYGQNIGEFLYLPMSSRDLSDQLNEVGIESPADEIPCLGSKDSFIKVHCYKADTELEKVLLKGLSPEDSIGELNAVLRRFYDLPRKKQREIEAEPLAECAENLPRFCECLSKHVPSEPVVKYYFPLNSQIYEWKEEMGGEINRNYYNSWGGTFACFYEGEIRMDLYQYSDANGDMRELLNGSTGLMDKIKAVDWDVESHEKVLYGCIKVTLTDSLTEEEKIEFKEWIFDQNEEGIGKIFEQQSRLIAEGELHISFRSRDDDYFIRGCKWAVCRGLGIGISTSIFKQVKESGSVNRPASRHICRQSRQYKEISAFEISVFLWVKNPPWGSARGS